MTMLYIDLPLQNTIRGHLQESYQTAHFFYVIISVPVLPGSSQENFLCCCVAHPFTHSGAPTANEKSSKKIRLTIATATATKRWLLVGGWRLLISKSTQSLVYVHMGRIVFQDSGALLL